ncbi:unnamed protein product [Phaedon cochleariae]|uniref:Phosphatidic acid phosphatase type 2/haloperoxidase domain-containing protein n=1 Tax=Phaedon cochleariae TaxID=80249 RepID=A0A9P0GTC8_PHACE|nr:unnamed protein product [Phaedon cochleariae]
MRNSLKNNLRNSLELRIKPYYSRLHVNDDNNDREDNKGMVSPAAAERAASATVRLNMPTIADQTKQLPAQPRPAKTKFTRRITPAFASNVFLAILVLSLLVLAEFGFIPGPKLGYYCQDPSISHKFQGEVVSPLVLLVGSLVLPLLVLLCTELIASRTFKKVDCGLVWYYYKECAIGCILVLALTQIAKVLVGEHRPHFFDVCEPDTAQGCVPGSFVESYRCTSARFSGYFLVDSSRSFPSGHSSVSWFVGVFSAYVIQTRLPSVRTGRLLKPFLISLCLTWSLLCSLTRITDRRHHWWDVLAGTTLGVLGALYTIQMVHKKMHGSSSMANKVCSSTTTLVDVKNKDATSVII